MVFQELLKPVRLEDQNDRFKQWITDYAPILYRAANGFAEGEDRKDLFQEILLAVWKAIPFFREQSQPSTFVYRVAHNTALSWKRSQKNYRRKIEQFEAIFPDGPHERSSREIEQLEKLYAAIRQLPPVDRSLAIMFLDDLSYKEMAAIHGLTENNVGVRVKRLKDKLAANLEK